MYTIVGKDNPPVSLKHTKGNPFFAQFQFDGVTTLSDVTAYIKRIDDPTDAALVTFADGSGVVVAGLIVDLSKDDADIPLPRGRYAFELVSTMDGVSAKTIKNSFFIIE